MASPRKEPPSLSPFPYHILFSSTISPSNPSPPPPPKPTQLRRRNAAFAPTTTTITNWSSSTPVTPPLPALAVPPPSLPPTPLVRPPFEHSSEPSGHKSSPNPKTLYPMLSPKSDRSSLEFKSSPKIKVLSEGGGSTFLCYFLYFCLFRFITF